MSSKRVCPNCGRKMKQQFIGLFHCKCGLSWKRDIGFFERTPNMVFALERIQAGKKVNEPRFSNYFIEKRGSSHVESLVIRGFPLFVAPDLFFKIPQTQKQYFYIGLKFRQYFSIKQACKHLQMPVVSYNSAFGEAALHYRTEYTPLRFCGNVVQRYSPSGRLPLS